MDFSRVKKILIEANEPKFRLNQIADAYWRKSAVGWEELSVLPKGLIRLLAANVVWSSVEAETVQKDKKDQSEKARLKLADGEKIETVLIRHVDGRRTVCVSSQAGCPLGCRFCATGAAGFKRNLSAEEIIDQVLFWARRIKKEKISNVVFMGMGEPFLNYKAVMAAVRALNSDFGLGARRISISTIGLVPGIEKIAKERIQINLAFSLHAPNDFLRDKLIPANRQWGIDKILAALDCYLEKTGRRVMVEYLIIDGVNDSKREAEELIGLFASRPLFYLNLIPYNETGDFRPSPPETVRRFSEILEKSGVPCTIRRRFGQEIDAACGQLAGRKNRKPDKLT